MRYFKFIYMIEYTRKIYLCYLASLARAQILVSINGPLVS